MRIRRNRRQGFTLVELMVVVAIIGMLAAVVTVNVMGQSHKASVGRVKADMATIKQAMNMFKTDCGRYPQQLNELWERPANANRWGPEPYLDEYPPKDAWGNDYVYNYGSGRDFEIISYGADGAPGGTEENADLSSKTINSTENNR